MKNCGMKNVCNLEKFSLLWPEETTADESQWKKTLGVENNDRNSLKSLPKNVLKFLWYEKKRVPARAYRN